MAPGHAGHAKSIIARFGERVSPARRLARSRRPRPPRLLRPGHAWRNSRRSSIPAVERLERGRDPRRRRTPARRRSCWRRSSSSRPATRRWCDEVWLVVCDPEAQLARLIGRGMTDADARQRIAAQAASLPLWRSAATRDHPHGRLARGGRAAPSTPPCGSCWPPHAERAREPPSGPCRGRIGGVESAACIEACPRPRPRRRWLAVARRRRVPDRSDRARRCWPASPAGPPAPAAPSGPDARGRRVASIRPRRPPATAARPRPGPRHQTRRPTRPQHVPTGPTFQPLDLFAHAQPAAARGACPADRSERPHVDPRRPHARPVGRRG